MIKSVVSGIIEGAVSPIASIFSKQEDRKRAVQTIQAKTEQAKQEGKTQLELNDLELDLIRTKLQPESLKDEFVTVLVFAPFITMLVGCILSVFGYNELFSAANLMLESINKMDINYGNLLLLTASAALGIRAFKR